MARKSKPTPAALAKPTGAPIPGMPAPGKVVTVDIRDMPAWKVKNGATVEHFEQCGHLIVGYVVEVDDGP